MDTSSSWNKATNKIFKKIIKQMWMHSQNYPKTKNTNCDGFKDTYLLKSEFNLNIKIF